VKTREETERWLAYRISQMADLGTGSRAVVLRDGSCFAGIVSIGPYLADFITLDGEDPRFNRYEVEISYAFGMQFWGNGYATEAVQAMCRHAFDTLKLERLVITFDCRNGRSRRVLERIGCSFVRNMQGGPEDYVAVLRCNSEFRSSDQPRGSNNR
jgi:RimJ/RimL family protein N-acetyltransferase